MIAIATPFAGSYAVRFFRNKALQELHPKHETIKKLQA
jgi:hypothetical protein